MKSKSPSPKFDTAIVFLTEYLASSSKPSKEVREGAKQHGITNETLDNAADHLDIVIGQRKGKTGHFWSLPTTLNFFIPEGTPPAMASFLVAYRRTEFAGRLNKPLVSQLAETAHLAIKEAGNAKPVSTRPSLWPFPGICPLSLSPTELLRMLRTVDDPVMDDPLMIRLLKLSEPNNDDTDCDEVETEREDDDGWEQGYREAMVQVGVLLRETEGELESPESAVTSVFKRLNDCIGKLGSGSDGTAGPQNCLRKSRKGRQN